MSEFELLCQLCLTVSATVWEARGLFLWARLRECPTGAPHNPCQHRRFSAYYRFAAFQLLSGRGLSFFISAGYCGVPWEALRRFAAMSNRLDPTGSAF